MVNNKTYCAINLIQIYPVDSAIHPSNNRVCFLEVWVRDLAEILSISPGKSLHDQSGSLRRRK